ncbi:MAG: hypothetical protein WC712_09110 [Candidatus Brocadiia bacterium]
MTIVLTCAECNRDYEVTKLKPGTRIRCRECNAFLTVPGSNAIACANCGAMLSAKALREGTKFRCSKCGCAMDVVSGIRARRVVNPADSRTQQIDVAESVEPETQVQLKIVDTGAGTGAAAELPPPPQTRNPEPPTRRFPAAPAPDAAAQELLRSGGIRDAYLVGPDGLLLGAMSSVPFDAELVSNAAIFLSRAGGVFGSLLNAGTKPPVLHVGDSFVYVRPRKDGRLLVVSSGSPFYTGELDEKIIALLDKPAAMEPPAPAPSGAKPA